MCVNCIRSQVDITEGIQKQVTLLWCKECERYLQPPKHWVRAALESKELLTLCIKRLKGLQKVLSQAPEQVHPVLPTISPPRSRPGSESKANLHLKKLPALCIRRLRGSASLP